VLLSQVLDGVLPAHAQEAVPVAIARTAETRVHPELLLHHRGTLDDFQIDVGRLADFNCRCRELMEVSSVSVAVLGCEFDGSIRIELGTSCVYVCFP